MLIDLLILVVILAVVFWCLTLLPIPQPFRNIIYVVLVVIVLIYLVNMLGGLGGHSHLLR